MPKASKLHCMFPVVHTATVVLRASVVFFMKLWVIGCGILWRYIGRTIGLAKWSRVSMEQESQESPLFFRFSSCRFLSQISGGYLSQVSNNHCSDQGASRSYMGSGSSPHLTLREGNQCAYFMHVEAWSKFEPST
ncbi:hypothetical protein E2542_SST24431 [Spatholobus suberectus]|nr:hypothetical protein E2542_SST24431 [Spatholobus suberectus]